MLGAGRRRRPITIRAGHGGPDGRAATRPVVRRMTVLVHDYLLVRRGAERTFAEMCAMFPDAPVRTLLYDPDVFAERLRGHGVSASVLNRLRRDQTNFRWLLPFLPFAAGSLEVGGHDLVLSSSSAFAHWVRPDEGATHVCYCYTPFRYAWCERRTALAEAPAMVRPVLRTVLDAIRRRDRQLANRPTHFVAISRLSQDRIRRCWGREAPIVHPPVEVERFAPGEPEDFVLFVGELVRHKQVGLVIEAAREARVPLRIVGDGEDAPRLKALAAGSDVRFLGRLTDAELEELMPRARALVVPNIEEFGITAVEAQAAGRPVVAAAGGGTGETIVDGRSGLFFPPGDARALAAILRGPQLDEMVPGEAVRSAERFSAETFRLRLGEEIRAAQPVAA